MERFTIRCPYNFTCFNLQVDKVPSVYQVSSQEINDVHKVPSVEVHDVRDVASVVDEVDDVASVVDEVDETASILDDVNFGNTNPEQKAKIFYFITYYLLNAKVTNIDYF